ncbi:MAG TPA: STAS/SEC14 domain-containing protein [Actinomycetospora sp.]|jgi:hypothetical protein|uniref:STAS/SEC14 domain-containing protein n=1 Tax=Actinomycetospora sp. TaxID=1872135 RepID=UPI002F41D30F
MIERDLDVPAGVDAVRPVGTVTRGDYEDVVVPLLDAAAREHRRLRMLCVVDETFTGMTPAAVWEDLRIGLGALRLLAACAVVSDLGWVTRTTRLTTFFLPAHVRVFRAAERDAALAWLADLPGELARVHLRGDDGVVVAELDGPLRREDVDLILAEVDDWLATHAELPGLVLHAPAFPGWENVSGLLHHLRFVAGHQDRIRRVALVVPGAGVELAAGVAGTVLHPEVRRFDHIDDAVRWAAVAPVRVG